MPDRGLWQWVCGSLPIPYLIGLIDYLFNGHLAGARALICLYLVTVETRMVAETRRFLLDSGKEKPDSQEVIQGLLKLEAWRSGYLSLDVFYNKFIQRMVIWAVLLWVARLVHDACPEQGFSRFMVGALIGFELWAITGICLCCAYNATTNRMGDYPPTMEQIESMSKVVAALSEGLNLPIYFDTVLTHAEVADIDDYGPATTCERWDLWFLPDSADGQIKNGGDVIRGKAIWYKQQGGG